MICILKILDNTFFGTVIAGIILAQFGLRLYRSQKKTDLQYEDLRKTRELASLFLANLEISFKKYHEQLGVFNGKNPQLTKISDHLNRSFDDYFRKKTIEDFNTMSSKIGEMNEVLVAHLKIKGGHDTSIETLTTETSKFSLYLLSVSVLHYSKPDDMQKYQDGITQAMNPLRSILQDLIKLN